MTDTRHAHSRAAHSNGRRLTTGLAVLCLSLVVPSLAAATTTRAGGTGTTTQPTSNSGTGGGGLTPTSQGPAGSVTTTSIPVLAQPAGGEVSASGNGFTLITSAVATYKRGLAFSGYAPAADAGTALVIQRLTDSGTWQNAAITTIGAAGAFSAVWRAVVSGRVSFRAVDTPNEQSADANGGSQLSTTAAPGSPSIAVTVYQPAVATLYGPGFYGHKTACGQKLKPSTLGVASRTLRCGTKVSILFHGRAITVPVIDRGPYSNGASWDLTMATAKALSDPETETVGAAVI